MCRGPPGDIANLVSVPRCLLLRRLEEQLLSVRQQWSKAGILDFLLRDSGHFRKAAWRKRPLSVKRQVRVQQPETSRRELQVGGTA